MRKSLLNHALKIALEKLPRHPELLNFIHFSFIVQGNKILGYGVNNNNVPKIHYGYGSRIRDQRFTPKTHSEVNSFIKLRGIIDFNKPFEMINIRLNRKGHMRNSRPCECCLNLLFQAFNCSKIYYSCNDGGFMYDQG